MNQTAFLKQLLSLPKITLADMEKKSKIPKISKTAISSPIFVQLNDQPNVVVDVREPFYIDRYKRTKHLNCHQEGQCMACFYAKFNSQQSSTKQHFIFSKRNPLHQAAHLRYNSQSLDKIDYLSREKLRNSEGGKITKAFIMGVLKDKISLIEQGVKTNFKKETGHESDENKVVQICLRYFLSNIKTEKKQITKQNTEKQKEKNLGKVSKQKFGRVNNLKSERNQLKFEKKQSLKTDEGVKINQFTQFIQQQVKFKEQKLKESQKKPQDTHSLEQVLKEIYRTNMTKLFTKESFINMYKDLNNFEEGFGSSQKSLKNISKSKKNITKLAIINIQKQKQDLQENKKDKKSKPNGNFKKKKVKIMFSEQSSSRLSKAQFIYTQLLIDIDENGEQNLGESVKSQLNYLSISNYKCFKGVIGGIESKVISHFKQKEEAQEKVFRKMETATNWMKCCVLSDDIHGKQKHKRLDKMLNNFKNIKGSKLKRKQRISQLNLAQKTSYFKSGFAGFNFESLTINGDEQEGNDNSLEQQDDSDAFDVAKKKKSNVKNKHAKKGENSHDGSKESISQNDSVVQKSLDSSNQSISADNTQKLIDEEAGDEYEEDGLNQGFRKRYSNLGKISNRKSSVLSRNNTSKNKQSDEVHWSQMQKQIQNFTDQSQNKSMSIIFGFQRQKQEDKKIKVHGSFGNVLQRTEEQQAVSQRQKQRERQRRKRYILRIKAAELLHKNEETINIGIKALQQSNLQQFVIHPFDSVLTQKKKIRYLKQIVRRKSENAQISLEIFQQIMEYLLVYEESCNILIEASGPVSHASKQEQIQNVKGLVGRKDFFNELLFYNLDSNYVYGGAEDQDINFTAKNNSQDKAKPEKKQKKNFNTIKILDPPKEKPPVFKPSLTLNQQLVQVQLQVNGFAQNYQPKSIHCNQNQLTFIKRKLADKDQDHQSFCKIQQFLQEKRIQRRKFRKTCDQSTMHSSIKRIRV